jgi:excisionase family DNA binding protein
LLPAVLVPRLLRIQDAARYLSATTWFVETLIRERKIPSLIVGKRRVIDVLDLDVWIENEKAKSVAKSGVDVAA